VADIDGFSAAAAEDSGRGKGSCGGGGGGTGGKWLWEGGKCGTCEISCSRNVNRGTEVGEEGG